VGLAVRPDHSPNHHVEISAAIAGLGLGHGFPEGLAEGSPGQENLSVGRSGGTLGVAFVSTVIVREISNLGTPAKE